MFTLSVLGFPNAIALMVEKANLPLNALRVFYAIHFLIDRDPRKNFRAMGSPIWKSYDVQARKIVQAVFPSGTNDLRSVQSVGKVLIDAGLLKRYEYNHNGHSLTFQYSDRAAAAAGPLSKGVFAMIDSSHFARLSTPAQISLYVRIVMHQAANAPQFYLPIQPGTGTWIKLRKPWFTAAAKLSKILEQQYLICPEIDRMSERVSHVRMKISHDRTTWYARSLYCRHADKTPIVVSKGQIRAITREEVCRREMWTKVRSVPE